MGVHFYIAVKYCELSSKIKNILYFFKFMQCLLIFLLRVIDPAMSNKKRPKFTSESELLRQLQSNPSE